MLVSVFEKVNSATKYPSIPCYHALGDKGRLTPELNVAFGEGEALVYTEKIDGTNGRIIIDGAEDYIIGSREELLYTKGDRISTDKLGIVERLRPLAEELCRRDWAQGLTTFYLEVYGGKIGPHAKDYTKSGKLGYRLFDVSWVNYDKLAEDPREIAAWRDAGGQSFKDEAWLRLTGLPLTPRVEVDGTPPVGVAETYEWLRRNFAATRVALEDGLTSQPEGCVVRSKDRSTIAKIRFEDYRRTLRA